MKEGRFLTFEGGEGAGKTTQIKKLASFLKTKEIDVLLTREPGGSPEAERIRELLVQGNPGQWDSLTEYLLFSASRRTHLIERILPHLKTGGWVLCDRFQDSSLAYQHFAHGLERDLMEQIYQAVSQGIRPHLTFYLDISPQEGLGRTQKRRHNEDRFEKLGNPFHEKVREGYLTLLKENPDRMTLIDGTQQPHVITQHIQNIVRARFF